MNFPTFNTTSILFLAHLLVLRTQQRTTLTFWVKDHQHQINVHAPTVRFRCVYPLPKSTFGSQCILLLYCGTKHNQLPPLSNLGQHTYQLLKYVLEGKVTVIVQINVHNTLSICERNRTSITTSHQFLPTKLRREVHHRGDASNCPQLLYAPSSHMVYGLSFKELSNGLSSGIRPLG